MSDVKMILPMEWDSDFFGVPIARSLVSKLTSYDFERIEEECRGAGIANLQLLADPADDETIRVLETHSCHLTDVRILFSRKFKHGTAHSENSFPDVRSARNEDISPLSAIARTNHRDSRFYFDGGFSTERCDDLFETWIVRSCQGWADHVFVADTGRGAAGYITCHLREGNRGQIGLVGIGEGYQGKGLGGRLMEASVSWFAEQGCRSVDVATQGRNVNAQKLYQRAGFVTSSVGYWYHRWFA